MISDLGLNIKKYREMRGMTALKLATLSGVGTSTISQIENGNRQTLKGNTLNKIATALKVTVDELMGSDSEKTTFATNDIVDILNIISYTDFVSLDGNTLDTGEKTLLETSIMLTIDSIRYQRLLEKFKNRKKNNL